MSDTIFYEDEKKLKTITYSDDVGAALRFKRRAELHDHAITTNDSKVELIAEFTNIEVFDVMKREQCPTIKDAIDILMKSKDPYHKACRKADRDLIL